MIHTLSLSHTHTYTRAHPPSAMDAVECLKAEGIDVGLINKCCLNDIDEDVMALVGNTGFNMIVEPFNKKTGLGIRFGEKFSDSYVQTYTSQQKDESEKFSDSYAGLLRDL